METLNKNEPVIFEENLSRYGEDFKICKPFESVSFSNSVPFETPDNCLVEKIILLVEFLFSDANILKDKFLLKHIRRNKEGYVSISLISSLRKVKALSKDWRVVAHSLQKSQQLQMNEEKTKIRRIEPFPMVFDTKSPSFHDSTVLLFHNLPDFWSFESISRLLNGFKTVKSIVKINSRTDEMDPSVKKTLDLYEKVATFPFAVLGFNTPDEAANAILRTSYATSLIKLVPLAVEFPGSKSTPLLCLKLESSKFGSYKCKNYDFNTYTRVLSADSRSLEEQKLNFNDDNSGVTKENKSDKIRKHLQVSKESLNAFEFEEKTNLPCTYREDGLDNYRRTQKKFFSGHHKEPKVIILRQPKGPDGTKGFQMTRIIASNSLCF